mgnify:CR=1 FL=1
MKIIIDMPGIECDSTQGEIIKEWILEIQKDSDRENPTPLKYAENITFQ